MIAVEPEHGTAEEEAPNLIAAVVEDQAAPIRVVPLLRRGMLVQVAPVEVAQPMLIVWEVRRDPVEDYADPLLLQVIDEEHEILRRSVPGGRREITGCLIAPGAVK